MSNRLKFDFTGNTAFIFGGAGGISREIAQTLGQQGARICLFDVNEEALEDAVKSLKENGAVASSYKTDIRSADSVNSSIERAISVTGHVDILVNGASIITRKPVFELTTTEWERTIAINLTGTFLACKLVGKIMAENGYGRIVNFSSQNSSGAQNNADYSASKAGIEALTRSLAVEFRELNVDVTVNAISPPPTITDLWKKGRTEEQIRAAIDKKTVFEPAEMVDVIQFLCSRESGSISGQILNHKYNLFRVPNK